MLEITSIEQIANKIERHRERLTGDQEVGDPAVRVLLATSTL